MSKLPPYITWVSQEPNKYSHDNSVNNTKTTKNRVAIKHDFYPASNKKKTSNIIIFPNISLWMFCSINGELQLRSWNILNSPPTTGTRIQRNQTQVGK